MALAAAASMFGAVASIFGSAFPFVTAPRDLTSGPCVNDFPDGEHYDPGVRVRSIHTVHTVGTLLGPSPAVLLIGSISPVFKIFVSLAQWAGSRHRHRPRPPTSQRRSRRPKPPTTADTLLLTAANAPSAGKAETASLPAWTATTLSTVSRSRKRPRGYVPKRTRFSRRTAPLAGYVVCCLRWRRGWEAEQSLMEFTGSVLQEEESDGVPAGSDSQETRGRGRKGYQQTAWRKPALI